MPIFRVVKTFNYSETLEVEAASAAEAEQIALRTDDYLAISGDSLQGCEVTPIAPATASWHLAGTAP